MTALTTLLTFLPTPAALTLAGLLTVLLLLDLLREVGRAREYDAWLDGEGE